MKRVDLKRVGLVSGPRAVRRSEGQIEAFRLQSDFVLAPLVGRVRDGLVTGHEVRLEEHCQALVNAICGDLNARPPKVVVLSVRPITAEGELHGLYLRNRYGARPRVKVWMRTAARRQPVAFRTFVRTLLHELCHHLDVEVLKLERTVHTPAFFRREASLVHQVLRRIDGLART